MTNITDLLMNRPGVVATVEDIGAGVVWLAIAASLGCTVIKQRIVCLFEMGKIKIM